MNAKTPTPTASNHEPSDRDLLQRYVASRDEAAFRELVRRHVDFVYSCAERRLNHDAHSAADVAQQVFTALARQAAAIPTGAVLQAWLYTTTRHLSANWVRTEQARRRRELTAHSMNEANTPPPADWPSIRPILESALDRLPDRDRTAVLLRFFARSSYAQVGAALRLSEDAARMRVDRALDKLREALVGRGIASTSSALAAILTSNAVASAPSALAGAVAARALVGSAGAASVVTFTAAKKLAFLGGGSLVALGVAGFALSRANHASSAGMRPADESASLPTTILVAAAASGTGNQDNANPTQRPIASLPAESSPPVPAAGPMTTRRLDMLDALVGLTPEQRRHLAAVFDEETRALDALPLSERGEKGSDTRIAARAAVRAALTPEQRKKYDVTPQAAGGGLAINPANLVSRLDQLVSLDADQKQKALAIVWDDLIDQIAALPADQQLPGFLWHHGVRQRLRAVLSPAQQELFDRTPPYTSQR